MTDAVFKHKHIFAFTTFLDTNGDGILTWDDFLMVAKSLAMTHGGGILDDELLKRWTSIFQGYWDHLTSVADFNNDGVVEFHEWLMYFENICRIAKCFEDLPEFLKVSVREFFHVMDSNNDGKICIQDYKRHLAKYKLDQSRAEMYFIPMLNAKDFACGNALTPHRLEELVYMFYTSKDPKSPGNYILGPYDAKSFEEIQASIEQKKK